jgi:hypothetical protein
MGKITGVDRTVVGDLLQKWNEKCMGRFIREPESGSGGGGAGYGS